MAMNFGGRDITFFAGESLTDKAYYAVTMETDGKVDLADAQADVVLGLLQNNDADAEGDAARVRVEGTSECKVGAAVEEGARLMADTDGMAITATASSPYFAVALDAAAADGDIIPVRFESGYMPAA